MHKMESGNSTEHETDEGQVEPSLGVIGFDFVVAHQATLFHKPAEGALDDPAFGQDDKVLGLV